MIKKYYELIKPGIIYGNLLTAAAGFLLASTQHVNVSLLVYTLLGITLVIASGCVFNNYADRAIDTKMARTKKRALVIKSIPAGRALAFAAIIGVAGFLVLLFFTDKLVTLIGIIGFIDYVVLYGYSKRHSVHGTLVGSVSGAMPVLAGYTAARGHIDSGGIIVFLILSFWQMPHFYGIAMYRIKDYIAAGIPVLPAVRGMRAAKKQVLLYIIGFMVSCSLLTFFGYTGYVFLAVMVLISLEWLRRGLKGFSDSNDILWGRKMFLFSLIVILVTSIMLALGARLP